MANIASDSDCKVCLGSKSSPLVVACEECNSWFHPDCIGYEKETIDKIKFYYCSSCEDTGRVLTVWKQKTPNARQLEMKRVNYFEVDKILDYETSSTERIFKIKWKGYAARYNSWESEESLDGCLDLLQKYLHDNNLPLSKVKGLLGASNSALVNKNNWCEMSEIVELCIKYKNWIHSDLDIEIDAWTSFKDHDGLYFLNFDSHCYVILYMHNSKFGYIADGGNQFLNDEKTSREVRALLNIRLRSCSFDQQTRVDHCASSAVLIGLELVKAYKNGTRPRKLIAPKSWIERIRENLHKFDSAVLDLPPLHQRRQLLECTICKKGFPPRAGRKFHAHMLNHKNGSTASSSN